MTAESSAHAAVTMVRLYWREGRGSLDELVRRLQQDEGVRGLTVFRGILGLGASGELHTASLVDLSLDLPLVVEFFDTPERAARVIADLSRDFAPGHIVSWPATTNT